jgi:aryl-alcohol dehydrogenase
MQSLSAVVLAVSDLVSVGAPLPNRTYKMNFLQALIQGNVVHDFIEGHCIPDIVISQVIDLFMQGKFPFDKMITFYPLEKINEAVEDKHAGKVIKPVLVFGDIAS